MKGSPLVLALASALVGAVAWGNCQRGRASDATLKLEAALAAHALEDAVAGDRQDSLRRVNLVLRDSAALLTTRYTALRRFVPTARDSIAKLLARLPDSVARPLGTEITVLREAGEACHATLTNCEARAANAEQRAAGDSARLVATHQLLATTEAAWHSAEQKARPSFWRDLWRSRSVTAPLALVTIVVLLIK